MVWFCLQAIILWSRVLQLNFAHLQNACLLRYLGRYPRSQFLAEDLALFQKPQKMLFFFFFFTLLHSPFHLGTLSI